jgi:predicted DNA-binding protein (MmcQ/YjbR family)
MWSRLDLTQLALHGAPQTSQDARAPIDPAIMPPKHSDAAPPGPLKSRERGFLKRVRTLCLSLPETREVITWGHPSFQAGKRTFATIEWIRKRPSVAIRVNTADMSLLAHRHGFFQTPYGRGQWISAWADEPVDWHLVRRLLVRSYRTVALKRMIAALDG